MENNFYNIPLNKSLSEFLVDLILKETNGKDYLEVSNYTLFAPTKRMVKDLQKLFIEKSPLKSTIMPQIYSILDIENLIPLGSSAQFILEMDEKTLEKFGKTQISSLKRTFILQNAIKNYHKRTQVYDLNSQIENTKLDMLTNEAMFFAEELAKIIDFAYAENINLNKIEEAMTDKIIAGIAKHQENNINFIKEAYQTMPQELEKNGMLDIFEKKSFMLNLQAKIWEKHKPKGQIIFLGTMPRFNAVFNLLNSVKNNNNVRFFFNGIDTSISPEDWEDLKPRHPQFAHKDILKKLSLNRSQIQEVEQNDQKTKNLFIQSIFNNNATPNKASDLDPKNLRIHSFETLQKEIFSICSIILYELFENKNTVTLVTNNKEIKSSITNLLKKWEIRPDNAEGQPLFETMRGYLFYKIADMIATDFDNQSVIEILKHPLTTMGVEKSIILKEAEKLEEEIIFGAKNQKGNYEIIKANKDYDDYLTIKKLKSYQTMLKNIDEDDFSKLLICHIQIFEDITENTQKQTIWKMEEGRKLSELLQETILNAKYINAIKIEYPYIIKYLLNTKKISDTDDIYPGLFIMSSEYSQMIDTDVAIIADCNEGSFPLLSNYSPWLNKSMSERLGFPTPENLIGQEAFIFCQLFNAKKTYITRAEFIGTTKTNKSRFLNKITTAIEHSAKKGANSMQNFALPEFITQRAKSFTASKKGANPNKDYAKIHKNHVPQKISVTALEKLLQKPYDYYIEQILKLNTNFNYKIKHSIKTAEIGTIIHSTLEEIVKTNQINQKKLIQITQKQLENYMDNQYFVVYFWNIFLKTAPQIIEKIKEYEETTLKTEEKITLNYKNLQINGKADLIGKKNNQIFITDYKTGSVKPSLQILILRFMLAETLDKDQEEINGEFLYILNKGKIESKKGIDRLFKSKFENLLETLKELNDRNFIFKNQKETYYQNIKREKDE